MGLGVGKMGGEGGEGWESKARWCFGEKMCDGSFSKECVCNMLQKGFFGNKVEVSWSVRSKGLRKFSRSRIGRFVPPTSVSGECEKKKSSRV